MGVEAFAATRPSDVCAGHARRVAKRRLTLLLSALALLLPATGNAQGHAVSGRVTTAGPTVEQRTPLSGVSVTVKGTTLRVTTSAAGSYTISATTPRDTLLFAYLGYVTQEIAIDDRAAIDVALEQDVFEQEALVVVGYAVQSKASLTGAVSALGPSEIMRTSATTSAEALVGKIQGITTRITNSALGDARPGSSTILQIRNMGTPLFIIDGVRHTVGQFNNLNIADIESISILKDASASVYGFGADNGVVLVTTKSGRMNQPPQINVDAYYGVQSLTRYPFSPAANAYEFQRAWVESQQNRGQPRSLTAEELEKWRLGSEPGYRSFNQYDYVVNNPNAAQYNLNASASGGGNSSSYYLSVGRVSQDYVMKGHNFNRTNFQMNLRSELAEGLSVGTQLSGRIEERDNVAIPGRDDVVWTALLGINSSWPMDNPYANDNRDYVNGNVRFLTRLASTFTKDVAGWQLDTWRNMSGNFFAEYRFPFGSQLKGTYAYTYKLNSFELQRFSYDAYCYDQATDTYNVCGGFYSPFRTSNRTEIGEQFAQLQLNHRARIGDHNVSGVAAFELSGTENNGAGISAVPPYNYSHLIQFNTVNDLSDSWSITRRASYVGRFNYDYRSKYLVELLGRYDGSYLYAPGKRWGFFPGVSVGWRVSEEGFLRDRLGFLDDVKLRASWGQAGRDSATAWAYLGGATYGVGDGYVFDGTVVTGARPRGLPVINLSWVTSTSRNIGIDFSIFDRKLRGEFDIFERKLTGLPAQRYDVLLPSEVGYTLPNENLESEANRGIEGILTYSSRAGKALYSVSANATLARRRILDRYKPRYGNSWQQYRSATEHRWAGIRFGYEVIGQFKSMEEIENYPVNIDGAGNRTLLPGDLIYRDVNGDGIINAMDERPIGYGIEQNPILGFGFNGALNYGAASLHIDFAGGTMYSYNQNLELKFPFQGDHNSPRWMLTDRWHRADPYDDNSEWIPGRLPPIRRGLTNHVSYTRNSTFWRTNVRYVRMKRLELGFTLPPSLISRFGMTTARLYASGANLLSIDNLADIQLDPEVAQDSGLRYPTQRVVTFGISTSLGARVRQATINEN
jgi:TonB-linked SusC/RagA family outer membrane protein